MGIFYRLRFVVWNLMFFLEGSNGIWKLFGNFLCVFRKFFKFRLCFGLIVQLKADLVCLFREGCNFLNEGNYIQLWKLFFDGFVRIILKVRWNELQGFIYFFLFESAICMRIFGIGRFLFSAYLAFIFCTFCGRFPTNFLVCFCFGSLLGNLTMRNV